jgi:hypothetical protein
MAWVSSAPSWRPKGGVGGLSTSPCTEADTMTRFTGGLVR